MSTATEITRLTTARDTIRDKLIDLGLATSTSKLDALATAVDGIANRGAVSATVREGDTYTIPAGYHNGSGTVAGVAGGGNYTLQSKVVTPTKSQQSITPDSGYYGMDSVTVNAIPEAYQNVSSVTATAGDVLSGKIFTTVSGNVAGTMANNGAVSKKLDATSNNQTYTVPAGYHNGSGTVSITLESKSATPTTASQTITPTAGKVLSSVTVNPIPSEYADVSEVTATANDVLISKTFVDSSGELVTGNIQEQGELSVRLDTANPDQSIVAGYYTGGTVDILLEQKTATPTTATQNITPTSGKVLSKVTVNAIPAKYGDTTGDDAVAANVLSGKKAHTIVEGTATQITGTMANNGAISKTLDATSNNQSYTVPAGYHNGSGTVSITLESKSATPTTSAQTITPTSGKVLSSVTVNSIPSNYKDITDVTATASDVAAGQFIMTSEGLVEGTIPVIGDVVDDVTLDATTGNQSYTIPYGIHTGDQRVNITLETKTATPSTSTQNVTPTSGKVLSKVTVNAIPAKYGDTTGDTAVAANLLSGVKAHTIVNGTATQITGSMANNGSLSATIDGLVTTSYTLSAGYYSGGTVALTNDIETALAAI